MKKVENFMGEIGAYKFIKISKSGRKQTIYKGEDELTESDHDLLYQDFARHWDSLPLKAKNRFMKWLRESLTERQRKIDEERQLNNPNNK
jgi:hypothetical protein